LLLIRCPWCGPREEIEFRYGGEAHVGPPPEAQGDEVWARYLYFRSNPAGFYAERWVHAAGCRGWFNLVRDTTTHEIAGSYLLGEAPEDAR
jgi:heterotetrameric sarcosine oxidase delta subunit